MDIMCRIAPVDRWVWNRRNVAATKQFAMVAQNRGYCNARTYGRHFV